MRILVFSLDSSVCSAGSPAQQRCVAYGALADRYTVIAPSAKDCSLHLSDAVTIYGLGGTNKLARLVRMYKRAIAGGSRERYDVVSVQDTGFLALAALLVSRRCEAGFEVQVHGFEKHSLLRTLAAKFVLKRAHAVRVVSKRLAQIIAKQYAVPTGRITVAPIYVEPFSCAKRRGKQELLCVLTVGRLVPVKRIDLQLQAAAQLRGQGIAFQLKIVGSGPEEKSLRALARTLYIEDITEFAGQVTDIKEAYCDADMFVLSSDAEGWGMAVVEAAHAGLPIVMTDVGCANEFIHSGTNGIVVPHGSADELVRSIGELFRDKGRRLALGAAARQSARQLPNKEETYALYKQSWQIAAQKSV